MYQRAANLAAKEPEAVAIVQSGWGELFLEKYNTQDAVEAFRTALKADPKSVDAYLGIAQALKDEAPDRAAEAVKQVLTINRSSVEARLILAELALDERKLDEARKEIERAQDVNPSSLDAFAMQAAIAHLEGRKADFDAAVSKALAINPRYGDVYRIPGANSASHYRFEEAVALDLPNGRPAYRAAILLREGHHCCARRAIASVAKTLVPHGELAPPEAYPRPRGHPSVSKSRSFRAEGHSAPSSGGSAAPKDHSLDRATHLAVLEGPSAEPNHHPAVLEGLLLDRTPICLCWRGHPVVRWFFIASEMIFSNRAILRYAPGVSHATRASYRPMIRARSVPPGRAAERFVTASRSIRVETRVEGPGVEPAAPSRRPRPLRPRRLPEAAMRSSTLSPLRRGGP